jgi:hypothetical protein
MEPALKGLAAMNYLKMALSCCGKLGRIIGLEEF